MQLLQNWRCSIGTEAFNQLGENKDQEQANKEGQHHGYLTFERLEDGHCDQLEAAGTGQRHLVRLSRRTMGWIGPKAFPMVICDGSVLAISEVQIQLDNILWTGPGFRQNQG